MSTNPNSPSNGHLGTAWEVAVVVVFILLIFALAATAVFQVRRKQKRKQQRALNRSLDVERGGRGGGKSSTRNSTATHEEKCTEQPHSRASIHHDGGTCVASVNADVNRGSVELTPPSPTAQPKRLSKSSYHEYISKKPPKYYWDLRSDSS